MNLKIVGINARNLDDWVKNWDSCRAFVNTELHLRVL